MVLLTFALALVIEGGARLRSSPTSTARPHRPMRRRRSLSGRTTCPRRSSMRCSCRSRCSSASGRFSSTPASATPSAPPPQPHRRRGGGRQCRPHLDAGLRHRHGARRRVRLDALLRLLVLSEQALGMGCDHAVARRARRHGQPARRVDRSAGPFRRRRLRRAEFGPTWSPVTFYLALFLILLFRPQGLLGKKPEL